jgi:zinc D-Ala-D-Ala carboxypeptidase
MSEMLTKNFSKAEMACKCGCGLCNPDPEFMAMVQKVRDLCRFSLSPSSGCRCKKHNSNVSKTPDSAHTPQDYDGYTHAIDIIFGNDSQCFAILKHAYTVGFTRIGINFAKKFIHLDNDKMKPQNVLFSY